MRRGRFGELWRVAVATFVAGASVAGPAHAGDLRARVGPKQRVLGRIEEPEDVTTLEVELAEGSKFGVRVEAAAGRRISIRVLDPDGGELAAAEGRSAAVSRRRVAVSGVHRVLFDASDGIPRLDYRARLLGAGDGPSLPADLTPRAIGAGTTDVELGVLPGRDGGSVEPAAFASLAGARLSAATPVARRPRVFTLGVALPLAAPGGAFTAAGPAISAGPHPYDGRGTFLVDVPLQSGSVTRGLHVFLRLPDGSFVRPTVVRTDPASVRVSSDRLGVFQAFDGPVRTGAADLVSRRAAQGLPGDEYSAIAADGRRYVVGAAGRRQPFGQETVRAGTAWVQQFGAAGVEVVAELVPSRPQDVARFGDAVDVSSSRAVVGAPLEDDTEADSGAAYVFDAGAGWAEEARLAPPDEESGGRFGSAVAIDGDVLAVGEPQRVAAGRFEGVVRVFRRGTSGWAPEQTIPSPHPGETALFGSAIALDGTTLAASGPAFGNVEGVVSIHVFDGTSWETEQALDAPEPFDRTKFGAALALEGDRLLVGALARPNAKRGAVHVYERVAGTWSLSATIECPEESVFDDSFGSSVALRGDAMVLGARRATLAGGLGAAFLLRRTGSGWISTRTWAIDDPVLDGLAFGAGVALAAPPSGGTALVVTAPGYDADAANAGIEYVANPVD